MSVFAKTAPGPMSCMREIALSTVSYDTVPSSFGMWELTDGPVKGAERS